MNESHEELMHAVIRHASTTPRNCCNSLWKALCNLSWDFSSMSTNYRHNLAPRARMHGLKVFGFVDLLGLLAARHVSLLLTTIYGHPVIGFFSGSLYEYWPFPLLWTWQKITPTRGFSNLSLLQMAKLSLSIESSMPQWLEIEAYHWATQLAIKAQ